METLPWHVCGESGGFSTPTWQGFSYLGMNPCDVGVEMERDQWVKHLRFFHPEVPGGGVGGAGGRRRGGGGVAAAERGRSVKRGARGAEAGRAVRSDGTNLHTFRRGEVRSGVRVNGPLLGGTCEGSFQYRGNSVLPSGEEEFPK